MSAFRRFALVPLLVLMLASLSACGFTLRGSGGTYSMPFKSIYLGFAETSALGTELGRNLRGGDRVDVVSDIGKAEARFEVLSEKRSKSILSLNAQGRVREYLLNYTLVFRVLDNKGDELLTPTEIALKRPLTFNESQVLAKEAEEALLYRDMQTDLVQQIMRRLAAVKPN
ncbi:LPS assembly lipoprotein LptE [Massilia sp. TSP1-1-2]|uniref:LPS-assembly lipoprotein LptE n=1 Tax=unclassified Massilia TaxID=2609279 RepID=UPI003CF5C0B0